MSPLKTMNLKYHRQVAKKKGLENFSWLPVFDFNFTNFTKSFCNGTILLSKLD